MKIDQRADRQLAVLLFFLVLRAVRGTSMILCTAIPFEIGCVLMLN
jgi:hypothetical protein